jgi:acetyl-CoA acetyltransferase
MSAEIAIVGAGIHRFGRHEGVSALAMGVHAARAALADAGLEWADMQFAYGGSEDGGNADTMVADLGPTGIPFVNVKNGCATGGSSLVSAVQALRAGTFDVGLVVGFDKHARGAFGSNPADYGLPDWYAENGMMVTTQFFALKIQRYLHDHGLDRKLLAELAAKALRNGAITPHAWRRKPVPADEIANATMVNDPLTAYMFCSPSEGGAAVVLMSTERARQARSDAIEVKALEFRTRRFGTFEVFSPWLAPEITDGATVHAAQAAFEQAGIGPDEIDVAQLQDTEAGAELMHLAECGFCEHGQQDELVMSGALEIGGRLPVNTDGGLIANGEPIGASGLRQIVECVQQLWGRAGDRQVPGEPRTAFTQVYGAPGISVCSVLAR